MHPALLMFAASVTLTPHPASIEVTLAGRPFTTFHFSPEVAKPYLYPLITSTGQNILRRFPMEDAPSDGKDRHHRGIWLGYKDINGFNFWENEFSYNDPKAGKILATSTPTIADRTIRATLQWLSPAGQPILEEIRAMTFAPDRTITFDITLRALIAATFADSKDGLFALRLTESLATKDPGPLAAAWGKPAASLTYAGVTIAALPGSDRLPPRWHVRDYGLLAVNPIGQHAFDPALPAAPLTLKPGESLHLKYQVLIP